MLLYDGGRAANPRRVRMFLAEKGIEVPLREVDMASFEHRSDEVTALNPFQRLPVLVLDDNTVLSESIAICRYFEELHPEPPLMGVDALDAAIVDMWNRRMEMHLLAHVMNAFRHCHPAMKEWEVPQVQEFGEASGPKALQTMEFMDAELAERSFLAGERYTVADITAQVALDMLKLARIDRPTQLTNLMRWHDAVSSRPSAAA